MKVTMIFDIQRFSTHDGKGIRTVVFLKGCPLHCPWCENPESKRFGYDIAYDRRKCIGCHTCIESVINREITIEDDGTAQFTVKIQRDRIQKPEKLKSVCPSSALTVIGEEADPETILKELKKDIAFFKKSGGGVTLSGGEPFSQPYFVYALLKKLKEEKIHTAVETSLHCPWSVIEKCLPFIDHTLADIKHTDTVKLEQVTGGDFSVIKENFHHLSDAGARVTARVPVIPGFNDTLSEMKSIIEFASGVPALTEIDFLPFHSLGEGKYSLIGEEYTFTGRTSDNEEQLIQFVTMAEERGLTADIGG